MGATSLRECPCLRAEVGSNGPRGATQGPKHQASVAGSLEDVGDQPREASSLLVSPLLESLVERPVGGEGDPGGLAVQQISSWLQHS